MVAKATLMKPISSLLEGDCFFYMSAQQRAERQLQIDAINNFRRDIGSAELTPSEAFQFYLATAHGFVVEAIVRQSGERCVKRLSDGSYWIWYDGSQVVQWTPDRQAFNARLEEMHKAMKAMNEEQTRMSRARSKKQRRQENEQGSA